MLYARLPTAEELESTGLSVDDYEETAEIWPENWPAFSLFLQLGTQWRVGVAGRTGLDYLPLFALMDRQGLTGDAWQETFDDIRALEEAALDAMRKQP